MAGALSYLAAVALAAAAAETPAVVIQAADTPVKLDRATVVTATAAPPVLVYSATNATDDDVDEFTVIAFVFDAQGTLKARQTAPARRSLQAHATKFSTLVLDGSPVSPGDRIVVGVNQAQKVRSDLWWRAELQDAALAAVHQPKR